MTPNDANASTSRGCRLAARRLLVDGWHLAQSGVGMAVYARRLVAGLQHCEAFKERALCVVLPAWQPRPTWLEDTVEIRVVRAFRTGHPLLDEVLWKDHVGAWTARWFPKDILFSPAPFWARRAPAYTVVTQHDCIYRLFPRYRGRLLVRRWMQDRNEAFLRRARLIFTESEAAGEDLVCLAGAPRDRLCVIPAWLPRNYTPERARQDVPRVQNKYKLPPAGYWLYVGGYDYRKDVETLVAAYATVTGSRPPLVLAGRIPSDLKKPMCDVQGAIIRAGLPPGAVCMPGFIEEDDMPGLYGGASLFVYPSLYEGFGLPPLEAMGCGCPSICADNSSLPEVVRDPEYRFPGGDKQALAALLSKAAATPLPLNPLFCRARHDEAECLARYMEALTAL